MSYKSANIEFQYNWFYWEKTYYYEENGESREAHGSGYCRTLQECKDEIDEFLTEMDNTHDRQTKINSRY